MKFTGNWHITEMDEWDEDYFNLEVQAYLKINREGGGEFQFGLVRGSIVDAWADEGGEGFEFRWEGSDEMDETSGSYVLNLTDKDHLEGESTFDNGDSSGFLAGGALISIRLALAMKRCTAKSNLCSRRKLRLAAFSTRPRQ
jgi:hypothetical protein